MRLPEEVTLRDAEGSSGLVIGQTAEEAQFGEPPLGFVEGPKIRQRLIRPRVRERGELEGRRGVYNSRMARLASKIRYLRDCYRADTRGGGIYSLFDSKLDHLRFLTPKDRLLSSVLDRLPMIGDEVAETAKAASLYRRERSLLYMAFPIVGRPAEKGNLPAVLCAPLLVFPASLEPRNESAESVDTFDLRLDIGDAWLNTPAIAAFLGAEELANESLDSLLDRVPEPPFVWEDLYELVGLLEAAIPGLDASTLHQFPQLIGREEVESRLRSARRRRDQRRLCLPACALALVPNSIETRGTLFELNELAASDRHSQPLRLLLGEPPLEETGTEPDDPEILSPAVLSQAQQKVVRSAARNPLTVVIGPPGTGKSFTLAALALDHVSRGESVLIAARRNQVLQVLDLKLEELLQAPSFALRAGRRQHLKKLKERLSQLLQGGRPIPGPSVAAYDAIVGDLVAIKEELTELESTLRRRSGLEQQWGRDETSEARGWEGLVRFVSQKWTRRQLQRLPDHWHVLEKYERALDLHSQLSAERIRAMVCYRIRNTRRLEFRALSSFLKGLQARHSAKQAERFGRIDLKILLRTFPLWLVKFTDAPRTIPRATELFDLVIIDEATQCDLATCLPLIERGRRLVITGDPKQLRHVSFLSRSRQQLFAERYQLGESDAEDLDYRDKSLLDRAGEVVWRHDQSVVLDEHFRSSPQIIEFSNRELYGGELRVMTRRPETVRRKSLELRRIDGRRGEDGTNREEAKALIDELARWTEREQDLPQEACHSLGVLSPFRDQVDLLAQEMQKRLGLTTIEKHELLVGTPFAFQGEERDVMFLSLAVDADSHPSSFLFLSRPDVFNVSITRARGYQFIFCSLDPGQIPAPLARKYLEELRRRVSEKPGEDHADDEFSRQVSETLVDRGYHVWPAYEVAGLVVDLVVERESRTVGIDLIGHPGRYAESFDLERCRMLKRAGLPVFPLPYSAWHADPLVCLQALDRFWQDRSS